jgi:hypothetical protein
MRLLALVLLCMGLVCPAEGKQLRATGTMFFCAKEEDLMMYVVAMTAQDKDLEMPGCMTLKPGTRYIVLEEAGTGHSEQEGVVRVRIRQSRRKSVEGYLVKTSE